MNVNTFQMSTGVQDGFVGTVAAVLSIETSQVTIFTISSVQGAAKTFASGSQRELSENGVVVKYDIIQVITGAVESSSIVTSTTDKLRNSVSSGQFTVLLRSQSHELANASSDYVVHISTVERYQSPMPSSEPTAQSILKPDESRRRKSNIYQATQAMLTRTGVYILLGVAACIFCVLFLSMTRWLKFRRPVDAATLSTAVCLHDIESHHSSDEEYDPFETMHMPSPIVAGLDSSLISEVRSLSPMESLPDTPHPPMSRSNWVVSSKEVMLLVAQRHWDSRMEMALPPPPRHGGELLGSGEISEDSNTIRVGGGNGSVGRVDASIRMSISNVSEQSDTPTTRMSTDPSAVVRRSQSTEFRL